MSPPAAAPPARPRPARRGGVRRLPAAFALAGLLSLLLAPFAPAATCGAGPGAVAAADCCAPVCPGCVPAPEDSPSADRDDGALAPAAAGCGCAAGPAGAPSSEPASLAGRVERPDARESAAPEAIPAVETAGAAADRRAASGPSPESAGPLHLRNCVLRN